MINANGKYVLISGCDTGFGHGLAIDLDKQGFNVLATVFSSQNIISLQNKLSSNAAIFHLDITKPENIDTIYDLVKRKTNTIHALINNAGIVTTGFIDLTSMENLRTIMEVNFFGHVTMTKKFLPLLIAKRNARVINISAVAGYLASPSMFAYCASKYALESFSDCLRREMHPWDLHVSIIEPGFMRTPIIEGHGKPFKELWDSFSNEIQERYGNDFIKFKYINPPFKELIKRAEDPNKVILAIRHAVMNKSPSTRYRPGWQSSFIFYPISLLPAPIVDWIYKYIHRLAPLPASALYTTE